MARRRMPLLHLFAAPPAQQINHQTEFAIPFYIVMNMMVMVMKMMVAGDIKKTCRVEFVVEG